MVLFLDKSLLFYEKTASTHGPMCKISSIPINPHLNNCGKDRSPVFVYLNCPKHLSQSRNDFSATGRKGDNKSSERYINVQ